MIALLALVLLQAESRPESSDVSAIRDARFAILLQDDPETERKSFQVAEGYEVTLFASEKEGIVKPLQIRFDPKGRLWVTCGQSYPQLKPGEKPDDTIVILEDADGDGRAEKSTVWARGLNMPMGLELGKGGAYVGEGESIVHFKDENGKAGQRTLLFKGFYSADSHQNINSFVWGPGGELLFCQGLHIASHVETPWGVEKLDKAGVWRMREKRGRLDPFLGDDMGPQNPYGVVFDDYGQPIMVSGNGQGVYYLLPAMIRTRHFQQFAQIWNKTLKIAGADIIQTAAMPEDVQGVMVGGGFLNNAVYWFQILEDHSGFRVKDLPALIVSKSPVFRAVDVRMGPDGAIYVADPDDDAAAARPAQVGRAVGPQPGAPRARRPSARRGDRRDGEVDRGPEAFRSQLQPPDDRRARDLRDPRGRRSGPAQASARLARPPRPRLRDARRGFLERPAADGARAARRAGRGRPSTGPARGRRRRVVRQRSEGGRGRVDRGGQADGPLPQPRADAGGPRAQAAVEAGVRRGEADVRR
jgi:glucose/arabinose dehydrogenase